MLRAFHYVGLLADRPPGRRLAALQLVVRRLEVGSYGIERQLQGEKRGRQGVS